MQLFDEFVVQPFLARQCPLAGAQYLVFELLEFRRDETLGALERLAARVIRRRLAGLALADLDVIAVHPVVTQPERRDAGTRFFARLEVEEVAIGVRGDRAQLVEFLVIAFGDDATVAHEHRRRIDDRARKKLLFAPVRADPCVERRE